MAKEAPIAACVTCAQENKKFIVSWNAIGKRQMQRHHELEHPALPKDQKAPVNISKGRR